MLLGNENLLSKKEEIIKTVYISEMLSLMSVPMKETKTITSVMPVKIKPFKWWLYSGFFFTVMLWAASIELLLGLVAYLSSCFKFFACPNNYTVWVWMFSGCQNYDLLEVIERFSYDLEMKTSWAKQKQQTNGNRAIWLVYRTDTNTCGFWLVKQMCGWKNFMPENFL